MSICKNYCLSSLWYAAFAVFWQASCIMYPAASYNTDIDFPILSLCVFFCRSGKKRRPAPLRRMEIHQPADAEARNGVVQRCVREGRHLQGEIMGWNFFFFFFFQSCLLSSSNRRKFYPHRPCGRGRAGVTGRCVLFPPRHCGDARVYTMWSYDDGYASYEYIPRYFPSLLPRRTRATIEVRHLFS